MKAIILAGGIGKRMWPIAQDKYLLPFLGKPLIYHNLKTISQNSQIDEFVIVTKKESKEKVSQIAKELNLKFQIAIQAEPKGMADAVLSARDLISGPILVINAEDILDESAYKEVVEESQKTNADVFFTGISFGKYFPGGYLKLDADKVLGIVEKPGEGNEPSKIVKLVVDYFKDGQKLLEHLEKTVTEKDDQYEAALASLIDEGLNVRFGSYKGKWTPLKYPWHVLSVTEDLLSKIEKQISPDAKISDKATVEGEVIIEEGARVFEGAAIKGPCYIGKDVIVGNNSMVRESDLEEGCVTGFNSDITRSYIGPHSWFHTNYIGDSVVEGDFGMGSGAVLANLRLDDHTIRVGEEKMDSNRHKLGLMVGKGSRVGINASVMPGVRIGSNCLVGPGVVLHEDVKDNTKIVVKQEYEETKHTPVLTSYNQFRDKI